VLLAGLSGVLMNALLVPAQPAVAAADVDLRDGGDARGIGEESEERLAA
jgi:hypothetical protein